MSLNLIAFAFLRVKSMGLKEALAILIAMFTIIAAVLGIIVTFL